jgi:diguanylate cyclase (GGDEF)-like protein
MILSPNELERVRTEFHVLVVEPSSAVARSYVNILNHAGFKTTACSNLSDFESVIRLQTPHIVVVGSKDFAQEEQLIGTIRQLSPEIQIIFLVNRMQFSRAWAFVEEGKVFDAVPLPLSTPSDLILRVDRAAERLYYQYQNEHLQQQLDERPTQAAPIDLPSKVESRLLESVELALQRLSDSRDPGQSILTYLHFAREICDQLPVAYFKFMPSHFSFIYSSGVGVPDVSIPNVGVDLRSSGLKDIRDVFARLSEITLIKDLMARVYHVKSYMILPHVSGEGDGLGFFVVMGAVGGEARRHLHLLDQIFKVIYDKNVLLRLQHSYEYRDPLMGLYSFSYFENKLRDEMARARRLGLPLSLVALTLDQFQRLQDDIGTANSETVLKMMGILLKKTSRLNDILAYYDRGRVLLLLPHTPFTGAQIKGDRLRKMIGSARFPMAERQGWGTIKASVGISEYPSLCASGEELIVSALAAAKLAEAEGGDRVAIVQPPLDFEADFAPAPVVAPGTFGSRRKPDSV